NCLSGLIKTGARTSACCVNSVTARNDSVAKSPTSGVAAIFQDLDILMYVFAPEKLLLLGGRNFCLAIL
ncbi:MAG: hypothetical protein DRH07_08865, partial [Deltaproteobacteria bacterium]